MTTRQDSYARRSSQIVPPTPQPAGEGADGDPVASPVSSARTARICLWLLQARARRTALSSCLNQAERTLVFNRLPNARSLSINRDFSAPIKLTTNLSSADLRRLAAA